MDSRIPSLHLAVLALLEHLFGLAALAEHSSLQQDTFPGASPGAALGLPPMPRSAPSWDLGLLFTSCLVSHPDSWCPGVLGEHPLPGAGEGAEAGAQCQGRIANSSRAWHDVWEQTALLGPVADPVQPHWALAAQGRLHRSGNKAQGQAEGKGTCVLKYS